MQGRQRKGSVLIRIGLTARHSAQCPSHLTLRVRQTHTIGDSGDTILVRHDG